MFHSDEITSETCLIDGLEESFDLHFTWSSINHLSPDLKYIKHFFFFPSEVFGGKKVTWTWRECPSGATAAHWPSSNIEREFSNESTKSLKKRASRSRSVSCSPPLYCCPPPLRPENPVSRARGGSQAVRQHQSRGG